MKETTKKQHQADETEKSLRKEVVMWQPWNGVKRKSPVFKTEGAL